MPMVYCRYVSEAPSPEIAVDHRSETSRAIHRSRDLTFLVPPCLNGVMLELKAFCFYSSCNMTFGPAFGCKHRRKKVVPIGCLP